MGFLKHFVLPALGTVHALVSKICLIDEGLVAMVAPALDRDLEDDPPSVLETHFTRVLGGAHLMLLANCAIATVQENSHYRGIAILLEAIYFSVDSYSYMKDGRSDGTPTYALLGLSMIGLGVHAMEPGIFTKDKMK